MSNYFKKQYASSAIDHVWVFIPVWDIAVRHRKRGGEKAWAVVFQCWQLFFLNVSSSLIEIICQGKHVYYVGKCFVMQVEGTQRDDGAVILASVVEKAINSGFQRMMVQARLSYGWETIREESWLGPGFPMGFQVQIHSACAFLTSSALVEGILCRKELF